jgi:ABC-type glutathione transport system ATPase component
MLCLVLLIFALPTHHILLCLFLLIDFISNELYRITYAQSPHLLMLSLSQLHISIHDKPVVRGVSATFEPGRIYYLLGKNGSGKSSLAMSLMGHPRYSITSGDIALDGSSLFDLAPDARSLAGVFLSFQHALEIK